MVILIGVMIENLSFKVVNVLFFWCWIFIFFSFIEDDVVGIFCWVIDLEWDIYFFFEFFDDEMVCYFVCFVDGDVWMVFNFFEFVFLLFICLFIICEDMKFVFIKIFVYDCVGD